MRCTSGHFRFADCAARSPLSSIHSFCLFTFYEHATPVAQERNPTAPRAPTRRYVPAPATSHQPPATSHQPPATSHQPPATSHQPLATSHYLPHRLRDAGNVGAIGVFQDRRERHRNIRRSNAHNRSLEIIAEPLKETGCDFCADTACLWTFLDNHDTACLLDGLTDSSVVNRRKTAHIDNLSMNVARGECLGGEHAEVGHQQPAENGCIRAFAPYHGSIKRHHELLLGDVARRIYPSRFCTRPFRAVKQFMLKNHNRIVIAYGGFQNSVPCSGHAANLPFAPTGTRMTNGTLHLPPDI